MPRRLRLEFSGAKYHVTCRGNGRELVYYADADRARFMDQLQDALEKDGIILYAYALMPNHYHLLLETPQSNLHGFMQRLNTAYGMFFRYKRRRPGHCFQGRYQARLVAGDDYILRLIRYIHLNPVKTDGMEQKSAREKKMLLQQYPWSSHRGYLLLQFKEKFVNYRWLGLMGGNSLSAHRKAYARHINRFVDTADPVISAAYRASEYAIGDEDFISEIEAKISRRKKQTAFASDVRWPDERTNKIALEVVSAAVAANYRIAPEVLLTPGGRAGEAKGMFVEAVCRVCGLTQRGVAGLLGTSEHAIGKQRMRIGHRLKKEPALQVRLQSVLNQILGA